MKLKMGPQSRGTEAGSPFQIKEAERQQRLEEDEKNVQDLVEKAKKRRNNSVTALGKLKRFKFLCITLVVSPDYFSFYITTLVTMMIVGANFAVSQNIWTWAEFLTALILLAVAFTCGFLVTTTDPGVYPRLREGEVDPLDVPQANLVYCRICGVKRPPLTSHCYTCNVCVLHHDHHCSILGGCVGQRSLRFFVGYLVCISSAICIGVWWILRRIFIVAVTATRNKSTITVLSNFSVSTESPISSFQNSTSSLRPGRPARHKAVREGDLDLLFVPAIFVLIVDVIVLMLVGTFTVMYIYYFFTSVTRRESQRGQNIRKTWRRLFNCPQIFQNFWSGCFPPSSMLTDDNYGKDLV